MSTSKKQVIDQYLKYNAYMKIKLSPALLPQPDQQVKLFQADRAEVVRLPVVLGDIFDILWVYFQISDFYVYYMTGEGW